MYVLEKWNYFIVFSTSFFMLFKYRFLLHFINNYPSDAIKNLVINHNQEIRLKASNAITTAKFKINKGQRSMLFSAAKLFNTYLHDFGSMDSESLKLRLAGLFLAGAWCWRCCWGHLGGIDRLKAISFVPCFFLWNCLLTSLELSSSSNCLSFCLSFIIICFC